MPQKRRHRAGKEPPPPPLKLPGVGLKGEWVGCLLQWTPAPGTGDNGCRSPDWDKKIIIASKAEVMHLFPGSGGGVWDSRGRAKHARALGLHPLGQGRMHG